MKPNTLTCDSHDFATAKELLLQHLPLPGASPRQPTLAETLPPVSQSLPTSVHLASDGQRKERIQMILHEAMDLLNQRDFLPAVVLSTCSRAKSRNSRKNDSPTQ